MSVSKFFAFPFFQVYSRNTMRVLRNCLAVNVLLTNVYKIKSIITLYVLVF